jgi:hypothetical protein
VVTGICNPSYSGNGRRSILSLRPAQAKLEKPTPPNKIQTKRDGRVAQVVEHLSGMYEALGSIRNTGGRKFSI